MRILIQSINFYPELTGIGKYTGEMAEWLASRGHKVRVITAPPYYPNWKVSPGYRNFFWSREIWRGIDIIRCPIWVPKQPGGFLRLLHLASFALTSMPIMLWQVFWRPDAVIAIEPPLFSSPAALITSSIAGAISVLHIQDYEIDAAISLGMVKGAWFKNLALTLEKFLLIKFDIVSTISNKMTERAAAKGVAINKIYLFPNWVETETEANFDSPISLNSKRSQQTYRQTLNIPETTIVALYSGNMGAKQGLEILSQIAILYRDSDIVLPRIHFIFCGDGVGRKDLEEKCVNLNFVQFLDLQPADRLAEFLKVADIHLLPQRADVADLVMPSKLTGMLASGRPVIAAANLGTEVANVVQNCGLIVKPGDAQSFFDALVFLAENRAKRHSLGSAGVKYALTNLDRNAILLKFESKIKELSKLI